LWRNHWGAIKSQASLKAKVAEMQFWIQELEFDVSRTEDLKSEIEALKKDIKIRDRAIEAWDQDLVLARKQAEEARAQALESEKTLDRVWTNLTEANEARAALTARVAEVQLEKDSLAVDKRALIASQKEAHARHKKLRKKSHHYKSKSKSKRLKKQLDLVPWLRVISWGRGSNRGFEACGLCFFTRKFLRSIRRP
jgi:DNA repair exonuclease SbcCD ATPase subunit